MKGFVCAPLKKSCLHSFSAVSPPALSSASAAFTKASSKQRFIDAQVGCYNRAREEQVNDR